MNEMNKIIGVYKQVDSMKEARSITKSEFTKLIAKYSKTATVEFDETKDYFDEFNAKVTDNNTTKIFRIVFKVNGLMYFERITVEEVEIIEDEQEPEREELIENVNEAIEGIKVNNASSVEQLKELAKRIIERRLLDKTGYMWTVRHWEYSNTFEIICFDEAIGNKCFKTSATITIAGSPEKCSLKTIYQHDSTMGIVM